MSIDSVLYLTKLECPVCGTINEFETIRVGAYTEGDRMSDFCPSVIKWRNPKYQKYHPTLFFTATCSNCNYTREFNNAYRQWKTDNNFRTYRQKTLKEKHLLELSGNNSIIKEIAAHLDQENYPDETAILKLILAIYDDQLTGHPSQLDQGRFYLRIAWMFRHMEALSNATGQNIEVVKSRAGNLNDIERTLIDLDMWWAGFKRNLEYVREAVETHFSHPSFSSDPAGEDCRDKLLQLAQLDQDGAALIQELQQRLVTGSTEENNTNQDGDYRYFTHDSFRSFLTELHNVWDGVPRDEREALKLTIKYYIEAFEAGREIARGNPAIQAAYLIAELSRQIGDHNTARKFFNNTVRMGQSFINEIKGDRTRTALARKILELAMTQGKKNLAEAKA